MCIADLERAQRLYRELRIVEKNYKNAMTDTGKIRISDMAHDCSAVIKNLLMAFGVDVVEP